MSFKTFSIDFARPTIRIDSGEYTASGEPAVLETLLGSCVAACLFDPVTRIGGMNHILLPGDDAVEIQENPRYGGAAMELLVRQMENMGAIRSRLQAKIFGGAHVLSSVEFRFGPGPKNVAQVLEYLARYSIPVISHDTGGVMPRILHFVSDTFKIYVKKIQPTI